MKGLQRTAHCAHCRQQATADTALCSLQTASYSGQRTVLTADSKLQRTAHCAHCRQQATADSALCSLQTASYSGQRTLLTADSKLQKVLHRQQCVQFCQTPIHAATIQLVAC